ncbi:MAG: DUF3783 domain-containing protein [Lachnospiraceae bacterium]|nr:DUF3783 domain-containing protein [Lachnospiraceae bacterium]
MKPSILLFQISKPQSVKLIKALLPLKIKIKKIRTDEYFLPIKNLIEPGKNTVSDSSKESAAELSDPMIVFVGLSNAQLDYALVAIRRAGTGPIPYKAVITPSNQDWNAFELLEELKIEHEKMHS